MAYACLDLESQSNLISYITENDRDRNSGEEYRIEKVWNFMVTIKVESTRNIISTQSLTTIYMVLLNIRLIMVSN